MIWKDPENLLICLRKDYIWTHLNPDRNLDGQFSNPAWPQFDTARHVSVLVPLIPAGFSS